MKSIAVVCNYQLKPERIGSMDRFYIGFDVQAKKLGYTIDWFFSSYDEFEFYKNLTVYGAKHQSVESLFLEHLKTQSTSYDVVITHFVELCTSFYKSVKVLSGSHIIAVDHNPRPLDGFSFKKRLKNKLKGIIYSKYINQFIGVSKYTQTHILKDYGSFLKPKAKVVYNGIALGRFKKRTLPYQNKFIVASHLRHSKGIQDLIKAVSLLDKNLSDRITIDIYGEGPYEKELKSLTKNLRLEKSISFKGSSSKLPELFCNYSYMLQPTYMECFSLSILESLSANVPVITTQVGGNLEVISNGVNGYVFPARNVDELVAILSSVTKEEMGITADVSKKIEQEYFLDKMVEEHIKCLPCI